MYSLPAPVLHLVTYDLVTYDLVTYDLVTYANLTLNHSAGVCLVCSSR